MRLLSFGSVSATVIFLLAAEGCGSRSQLRTPGLEVILGGGPIPGNPNGARVTMRCDDEPCAFECRLDTGERQPCDSPYEVRGLSVGDHRLSVWATNDKGWQSPETTKEWSVSPADRRHILLFIGDGMQLAHEIATSRYLHGNDRGLSFHQFPYGGFVSTWDISCYDLYAAVAGEPPYDSESFSPLLGYDPAKGGTRPYPLEPESADALAYFAPGGTFFATDSASSATAIATGVKTEKGNVSWAAGDPPGGELETIVQTLRRERGFSIGIVSTAPFSHATPAAFVSHNVERYHYYTGLGSWPGQGIADEIIFETRPEVVISGGHPLLVDPDFTLVPSLEVGNISLAAYRQLEDDPEYVFAQRQSGVEGARTLQAAARLAEQTGKRLFGLYGGAEQGGFEFRAPLDAPLAPLVSVGNPENPTLAEAVDAALQVLSRDREGFFLLVEQGNIDWANHRNHYADMIGSVTDLHEAVARAMAFIEGGGDEVTWENTLLLVTADHANSFLRFNPNVTLGAGDLPRQDCSSGCVYPDGEVTYAVGNHTNELVTLYATGLDGGEELAELFHRHEGAYYPETRIIDNTALYRILLQGAGLASP